jgi:ABC-type branched-subunit amino acid transport system substrate-binding protein
VTPENRGVWVRVFQGIAGRSKKEGIMMFGKKSVMALIAVLAVLLAADVAPAAPAGFSDNEIRIAQWGPQTGPAAAWGSVARGSKLLFDVINEEGGIHGRKIKYFIRDDQYNPAQTANVVKELVENQGIFAFVGGVSAAGGMAVKDVLAQNKVIWVGPATAVKEYVFPVQPYLFGVYPLYEDEASILTKYIVETLKMKKIGILYQNDAYGRNGYDGCKQRLATYRMSLAAEIPVEPTEKDLASQILRLKNSGAEAVLMYVSPTTAVIALKTAANVGYKPQWVSSNTLSDYPLMQKISGGLWEGVITGNFGETPESKTR